MAVAGPALRLALRSPSLRLACTRPSSNLAAKHSLRSFTSKSLRTESQWCAGSIRQPARRTASSKPKVSGLEQHQDLESFLDDARHRGLGETTTLYQGTIYELKVKSLLEQHQMQLERIGGKSDGGVDLRGSWPLDLLPLKVSVQCKRYGKKLGPENFRALVGTLFDNTGDYRWRDAPDCRALGILASPHPASADSTRYMTNSVVPLVFMSITLDGQLQQFICNDAASRIGLDKISIKSRYEEKAATDGHDARVDRILRLFYGSKPLGKRSAPLTSHQSTSR